MQIGVALDVLWLEVVAPDDLDLMLDDLGVLLFDRDAADELSPVCIRRVFLGQLADQLDHAGDGLGG